MAHHSAAPLGHISTLSTQQLRHLLIAKLHPQIGVECWGADREGLAMKPDEC